MIVSLELEYFRKHTNKKVLFTKGINTIRGLNEAGKSTILLAMLYALYGTSVMPLPLDDLVTWGEPVKKLKVTMVIEKAGRTYCFSRSKAGAECNFDGGVVTGQKEVSKFAAELLSADADKAQKLMFSSQKGLSAALDGGPTAISEYIEELSGMDLFDKLLDAAADHLTTGPTTTLDAAIAELETVAEKEPVQPNLDIMKADVQSLESRMDEINGILSGPVATRLQEVNTDLAMAVERKRSAEALRKTALTKLNELADANAERAKCQTEACPVIDSARHAELQQMMHDGALRAEARMAYAAFGKLPKYPDFNWEGSYDDMERDYLKAKADEKHFAKLSSDAAGEMKALAAKRITETACGLCGKDLQDVPEVRAKNAALAEQYAVLEGKHLDLVNAAEDAGETADDIETLKGIHEKYAQFYGRYHAYVSRDDSVVPCRLTWTAPVPTDEVVTDAHRKELAGIEASIKQASVAQARLPVLEQLVEGRKKELEYAQARAAEAEAVVTDTGEIEAQKVKAMLWQAEVQNQLREVKDQHHKASVALYAAEEGYRAARTNWTAAKYRIVELRDQRDKQVFNNTLVKKIKAARPIVAAKLWTVVLASVSTMFSSMRCEKSLVTRDSGGFMVNGKPAKGVSGSTQDILGLAMRVALIKTFIPDCPFLLLDEPMAACDDERSAALVSFVKTSGFDQVILITHETISDSLTENLIEI